MWGSGGGGAAPSRRRKEDIWATLDGARGGNAPLQRRSQLPLFASLSKRKEERQKVAEDEEKEEDPADASMSKKKRKKLSSLNTEDAEDAAESFPKKKVKKEKVSKPKKGAPVEVSSRRPISAAKPGRQGDGRTSGASKARDPRFDDMSGKLNMDLFAKNYAFLDEYRQEENQQLSTEIKNLRRRKGGSGKYEDAKWVLQKQVQQDKQRKHLGELETATREVRQEEREKVRTTGKMPYFHSKGSVRKIVLENRKKEKGDRGGKGAALEKHEKKLESRSKKKLPARRHKHEE